MTNGWGPVEKDKSNGESGTGDGTTITLNGTTYAKGLGAHAASDVRYASRRTARASRRRWASTTRSGRNGSVVFQVYADATKVYDSGVMTRCDGDEQRRRRRRRRGASFASSSPTAATTSATTTPTGRTPGSSAAAAAATPLRRSVDGDGARQRRDRRVSRRTAERDVLRADERLRR